MGAVKQALHTAAADIAREFILGTTRTQRVAILHLLFSEHSAAYIAGFNKLTEVLKVRTHDNWDHPFPVEYMLVHELRYILREIGARLESAPDLAHRLEDIESYSQIGN